MNSEFQKLCTQLGFVALGITGIQPPQHYGNYQRALDRGLPENLQYLVKSAALRRDLRSLLPQAQSVLCVALKIPAIPEPAPWQWASYCSLPDYHSVMRERLQCLLDYLAAQYPIKHTRICVDSAPILERELAWRANLGFCGKHQNLIVPHHGSFVVLGEALIDLDLCPDLHGLAFGLCAPDCACPPHCSACSQACPTKALSPNGYAPELCLAYWNSQHKGVIPHHIAKCMGARIWGCDTCQLACPFNRAKLPQTSEHPLAKITLHEIFTLSASKLRKLCEHTALQGAHPHMLQRNACIVAGNLHLEIYRDCLKELCTHPSPGVQSAANYALSEL